MQTITLTIVKGLKLPRIILQKIYFNIAPPYHSTIFVEDNHIFEDLLLGM